MFPVKHFLFFLCFVFFYTAAWANIIDNSANQPAFPPVGYSLMATVNPAANRNNITVQNQSTDTIQVWRDKDCAGTQLSVIVLGGASAGGGQGAAWSSNSFKNCIRVYAPSGSDQIAIYQN